MLRKLTCLVCLMLLSSLTANAANTLEVKINFQPRTAAIPATPSASSVARRAAQ